MSLWEYIFGTRKTPQELTKEWISDLKKELRSTDRAIRTGQRELNKLKREIKKYAKHSETDRVKIAAKSIVTTKKNISRFHKQKGHIRTCILSVKYHISIPHKKFWKK